MFHAVGSGTKEEAFGTGALVCQFGGCEGLLDSVLSGGVFEVASGGKGRGFKIW